MNRKYADLWARIVASTEDPDNGQACWTWTGKVTKRYPSMNVRRDGVHLTIKPHRAILVLLEVGFDLELFWDLYDAYSIAALEADHICYGNPLCINPDHLQWLPAPENSRARWERNHPDKWSKYRETI